MNCHSYNMISNPHAMDKAVTPTGAFPSAPQTVTYTGFDKVLKVKQGSDSRLNIINNKTIEIN